MRKTVLALSLAFMTSTAALAQGNEVKPFDDLPDDLTIIDEHNQETLISTTNLDYASEIYDIYDQILIDGSNNSILYFYQEDRDSLNQINYLYDVILPALETTYKDQETKPKLIVGNHTQHPMIAEKYAGGTLHVFRDKEHLKGAEHMKQAPPPSLTPPDIKSLQAGLVWFFKRTDKNLQTRVSHFCEEHKEYHQD